MRVQCTVHEIPLLSEHMKHQCLLWNSKTFCRRKNLFASVA
ncbi:hypothetical protein T06_4288 [Trichinella sp. T6]|nr:hypothetical protein T06_4288 [Trichinella sp. T6]